VLFGPPFAARDPLVKATATLGLLLILLGTMQWVWGRDPHGITLPTSRWNYRALRRPGQRHPDHRWWCSPSS
jgi:hypothetical protein